MSNKEKRNNLPLNEELEIFGEHKTRDQLRAEEKAQKAAEREALRTELRRRREAEKSGTRRKDVIVVTAVLVGIVLLCAVALGVSFIRTAKEEQWSINPERGSFADNTAMPEMVAEGPKANVRGAYFTKNNHLCVELIIGNGAEQEVLIEAVDVAVFDAETDELIGGGKAELEETLVIAAGDTALHTFYIAPQHIEWDETAGLPEMLSFTITIDHSSPDAE